MEITTGIIPSKQQFIGDQKTLDYKALCVFVACGFFLDNDTFFKEQKVLKPATSYKLDNKKEILTEKKYFKWHYSPIERSFDQVLNEFKTLFEDIIYNSLNGRNVILPLSGGLDSRTIAVALKRLKILTSTFSYSFEGGHNESSYAKAIAHSCDFNFTSLKVKEGYLWDRVNDISKLTGCYSEFTNPRQLAFTEEYNSMGDIFALGHWGDVLFDDMKVDDKMPLDDQVVLLSKKLLKPGCFELAERLWKYWELEGSCDEYLKAYLGDLLKKINITSNANANIRAFKSLHWAPRWTSVNLSIFESVHPLTLPYYNNKICEFICSVPEKYLANRQLQIAYIKKFMPALAKVTWQDHRPYNLYNYQWNKMPWNLPYRVVHKIKRTLQSKPYIQRNWELQFAGNKNLDKLQAHLFDDQVNNIVPLEIRKDVFNKFKEGEHYDFAYPLSMLLTLSQFSKFYFKN